VHNIFLLLEHKESDITKINEQDEKKLHHELNLLHSLLISLASGPYTM